MRRSYLLAGLLITIGLLASLALGRNWGQAKTAQPAAETAPRLSNPAIDMPGYLRISSEAADHRESRRVTEARFLEMSREAGTIVLDARSRAKYQQLHIAGAINLSFPDIAVETLAKMIPDKNTRILIYCNNNFRNADGPFPTKLPSASLNLSTYIALYNYGYRNLYELGPQLDPAGSILPFEGQQAARVQLPLRDAELR